MVPLQLAREQGEIEAALSELRDVRLRALHRPTRGRLREILSQEPFDVVHFTGHGGWHQAGYGVLFLETSSGEPDAVSGRWLAELMQNLTLPRLVLLNACETARESHEVAGVAAALVENGVPAVVAMQTPISDQAAREFSAALYSSLARKTSIDTAVLEGRLAISCLSEGSLEWAIPALFMRIPDGQLFPSSDNDTQSPRQGRLTVKARRITAEKSGEQQFSSGDGDLSVEADTIKATTKGRQFFKSSSGE
jgi:hypothetical protein